MRGHPPLSGDLRQDLAGLRVGGTARDQVTAGLHDPTLLGRNRAQSLAEHLGVLQRDRRDDGDLGGWDHIRRIETTAEPHLHHGPLRAACPERNERCGRHDVEPRSFTRHVTGSLGGLYGIEHLGQGYGQRDVFDRHAIDSDSFRDRLHVGRSVGADGFTGGHERVRHEARHRPLSLRPRHVHEA